MRFNPGCGCAPNIPLHATLLVLFEDPQNATGGNLQILLATTLRNNGHNIAITFPSISAGDIVYSVLHIFSLAWTWLPFFIYSRNTEMWISEEKKYSLGENFCLGKDSTTATFSCLEKSFGPNIASFDVAKVLIYFWGLFRRLSVQA